MLSLVSASVEALFFFFGNHTISGGSSRVAEAMPSEFFRRKVEEASLLKWRLSSLELYTEGGNQSAPGDQVGPRDVET